MSTYNDHIDASIEKHGYIVVPDAVLDEMSESDVDEVIATHGSSKLMRLPEAEVVFFEWLREHDPDVWTDLWGDVAETPYLVSLAYLRTFAGSGAERRYFIRDLQTVDNYYFTPDMLLIKESGDYLAASRSRLEESESLTLHQAFALQVSIGETDVWHFAYDHKRSVESVKGAVAELVDDHILVHVPKADHLTDHFDVD